MSLSVWQVDAFTDQPFRGNPAAVCILPTPHDTAWMQEVGREMNVSETAFLVRRDGGFDLRWFTPTVEVDLCGHATLARAHVLWQEHLLNTTDEAHFYTRSGLLTARRDGDLTELNFPLDRLVPTTLPDTVLRALNVRPKFTANGKFDYFLEVEDEAELRAITPAYGLLASAGRRGAIVTARSSTAGFDYVCRYLAPAFGIDEDPATGSIQCALGPYWQERFRRTSCSDTGADWPSHSAFSPQAACSPWANSTLAASHVLMESERSAQCVPRRQAVRSAAQR